MIKTFLKVPPLLNMDYKNLIDTIMGLDENIRYATICDMDSNQVETRHREGVTNYLSDDETKESLDHAVSSWKSRTKISNKIGKGKYVLAVYEKLRRVTVPLDNDHLLLVTIDNKGGQSEIMGKIMNQIYGDYTQY